MKHKVGDKVKIRSKEWYEKEKDEDGCVKCNDIYFMNAMSIYCGRHAVIKSVGLDTYDIDSDGGSFLWTDEMLEDTGCSVNECEKEEQGHIITLQSPNDPQVLLNQISTLTHTLDVLCTTGRAKSANIVEEKIMQLIEKL